MKGFKKAEFIIRQILCSFLAAEIVAVIYHILEFYMSSAEKKLRFELTLPIFFFFPAAICLTLLIAVTGCCFSKACYIVIESIHLPVALVTSLITHRPLILLMLSWRFAAYFTAIIIARIICGPAAAQRGNGAAPYRGAPYNDTKGR